MTGTEKQIKWAEDIKNQAIEMLDNMEYGVQTIATTELQRTEVAKAVNMLKQHINSLQNTKKIIDSRDKMTTEDLIITIKHTVTIDSEYIEYIPLNKNNPIITAKK